MQVSEGDWSKGWNVRASGKFPFGLDIVECIFIKDKPMQDWPASHPTYSTLLIILLLATYKYSECLLMWP